MNGTLEHADAADENAQAAQWVVRLERGLRSDEYEQLRRWLTATPVNHALLLHAAKTWDSTMVLSDLAALFPREPRRWRLAAWPLPTTALAALLGLVATAALGIWYAQLPHAAAGAAGLSANLVISYQTVVGEQRRVELPDGSLLQLNTNSLVQVHFSPDRRDLELLRGEALFKVAKDARRVFTVTVADSQFKAVGTAFNLRLNADRHVQLTVTEGRVQVVVPVVFASGSGISATTSAADHTEIAVDAGNAVTVAEATQTVEPLRAIKLEAATAWTHGMMLFDGEPLGRAIDEISRYSPQRFVIEGRGIEDLPVSGYFRIGDIDSLVGSLESNFGITVQHDGNVVRLRARPQR